MSDTRQTPAHGSTPGKPASVEEQAFPPASAADALTDADLERVSGGIFSWFKKDPPPRRPSEVKLDPDKL